MALDFEPQDILQEIRLTTVERALANYAVRLGVFGRIDAARDLISLYNNSTPISDARFVFDPLHFAWRILDRWPVGVSDENKSEQAMVGLRQRYDNLWPSYVDVEHQTFDGEGLARTLDIPARQKRFADATTGSAAWDVSRALVKALEISLAMSSAAQSQRSTKPDQDSSGRIDHLDPKSQDILQRIANRLDSNGQISDLAQSERLWPLLLDGALPRCLGLSEATLSLWTQSIIQTFTERLGHKPQRPQFLEGTIAELLEICNRNTRENTDLWYTKTRQVQPESHLNDPATEEAISSLQDRLGIALPHDYRQFLAASNGTKGFWDGICMDPSLHDTDHIKWSDTFEELDSYQVEFFDLPMSLIHLWNPIESDSVLFQAYRVLEIGVEDIDHVLLLPPSLVHHVRKAYIEIRDQANEEEQATINRAITEFAGSLEQFKQLDWCCLRWEPEAMEAFPSFRAYLEFLALDSAKEDKFVFDI